MILLYEISSTGQSIDTEHRLVVTQGQEGRRNGEPLLNGYKISLWGDENVLGLDRGGGRTKL